MRPLAPLAIDMPLATIVLFLKRWHRGKPDRG